MRLKRENRFSADTLWSPGGSVAYSCNYGTLYTSREARHIRSDAAPNQFVQERLRLSREELERWRQEKGASHVTTNAN